MKLNSRQLRQMIMEELESDEWEPQRGPPDLPELPKGTTYNAVSRHIKHGFDQMGNTLADYVGKLRDRGVRLDQDELERVIKMYADELLFSVAMEQLAPGTEPVVDASPVAQGEVPAGGTWLGTTPPDPGWDEPPE
jgi:hypothetical protein